jgi:hypothetical protein
MNTRVHHSPPSLDDLLSRIRGEFLEMPGLRLTREEARRLWALDDRTCMNILDALVDVKFLTRYADGRYMRPTEADLRFRTVKADLRSEPQRVSS